jgi:hypothetical protein
LQIIQISQLYPLHIAALLFAYAIWQITRRSLHLLVINSCATFTGHQLLRAYFEADSVDNTLKPDPLWGYFHGMLFF